MELLLYWHIIRKRLWITLLILLAFLLSYFVSGSDTTALYTATMRFVVGVRPELGKEGLYTYDRYYTWLTAEYLLDDLAEVIKSRAFAGDVSQAAGLEIPPGPIQGATSAGKLHRILTVHITWPNPDELQQISAAAVGVLLERASSYFAQLGTEDAVISLIDPPVVSAVGPSLRERLDLPLRLLIALAVGVALAFLLDYLDDSLRDRQDVQALQLPLLGEIPDRRSWIKRFWQRRSAP